MEVFAPLLSDLSNAILSGYFCEAKRIAELHEARLAKKGASPDAPLLGLLAIVYYALREDDKSRLALVRLDQQLLIDASDNLVAPLIPSVECVRLLLSTASRRVHRKVFATLESAYRASSDDNPSTRMHCILLRTVTDELISRFAEEQQRFFGYSGEGSVKATVAFFMGELSISKETVERVMGMLQRADLHRRGATPHMMAWTQAQSLSYYYIASTLA